MSKLSHSNDETMDEIERQSRREPRTVWQPISTAPKDGTFIWTWNGTSTMEAFYGEYKNVNGKKFKGWRLRGNRIPVIAPTHWTPDKHARGASQ